MSGIFLGDVRIGSVMKIVGEPPKTRWWAYSIHRRQPDQERKQGFPTRKAAMAWLVEIHDAEAGK